ncbi:MAG: hypothetical protein NVSMB44_43500 [Ktedonobacteraceae bacterium]
MDTAQAHTQQKRDTVLQNGRISDLLPFLILLATLASFLLVSAILPLYGLGFSSALLTLGTGHWLLLPTLLLFPQLRLAPSIAGLPNVPPAVPISWYETTMLLVAISLVFCMYLVALRFLAASISRRYLVLSTALLGIVCVCIPMVTSQDIFSYIIYARMGVIYHLNPITTLPLQIRHDPVFPYIYWRNQPSAYGPSWVIITCALQWLTALFDGGSIGLMVLALRLFGLLAHLWSVLLVWSIGGHLQRANGSVSARQRMLATLAFAWNPLLLFEACTNAHNDTILLLFLLFALWSLVRVATFDKRTAITIAVLLALATCLKVNIALLFPGYVLFLWCQKRRIETIALVLLAYGVTVVVLYVPFWGNGAIFNLVHVNPGTYRNINTPAEFLTQAINSFIYFIGGPKPQEIGSPAENIVHTICLVIFLLLYGLLCLRALFSTQYALHTPLRLIRWMTCAWFVYCSLGAPWFWPWYLVTFYGLFALLEVADPRVHMRLGFLSPGYLPVLARLLAFSMLALYCFYPWGLYVTALPWPPAFRWAYFRGLWGWLVPALLLFLYTRIRSTHSQHAQAVLDTKKSRV